TIHLPRQSHWISGLHFHIQHTEYLRLIKGAIFIRRGDLIKIISTKEADRSGRWGNSVIKIDPYVRHNWGRAEHYFCHVIVEEWTTPSDISKPLFFWNLNGILTSSSPPPTTFFQRLARTLLGTNYITLQLFVVFRTLDNFPIFLDLGAVGDGVWIRGTVAKNTARGVEFGLTYLVLVIAAAVGWLVGFKAVGEERTPGDLWEAWRKEGR
ncbi:uncharacterized protein BDR25DRAFT_265334, partial [Lindgomyces ingoldianus]